MSLPPLQQSHLHKYAYGDRSQFFHATVTSVDPHMAFAGTAPPLCIWNPPTSGVNLALDDVRALVGGGSFASAQIWLSSCAQPTEPTGGTNIVPSPLRLGGAASAAKAKSLSTTAAVAALMIAAGDVLEVGCALAPMQEGKIIVPPGYLLALHVVATTPSAMLWPLGLTWEEVPVV